MCQSQFGTKGLRGNRQAEKQAESETRRAERLIYGFAMGETMS
jgi:hypothetical protein